MTKMFDVRKSDAFRRLCEAEKVAQSIFYNAPFYIPGVLQTPAFAQEMICGISGLSAEDPEAVERIAVRNARHTVFLERLDGADAPEVHIVIDESALRRASAGSDTMRRQIEHLIEVSRKPTVHIGVIPMEYGPHQGQTVQFEVHDSANGSLVFFEGGEVDRILEGDLDRIAVFRSLVPALMNIAASDELLSKLGNG